MANIAIKFMGLNYVKNFFIKKTFCIFAFRKQKISL